MIRFDAVMQSYSTRLSTQLQQWLKAMLVLFLLLHLPCKSIDNKSSPNTFPDHRLNDSSSRHRRSSLTPCLSCTVLNRDQCCKQYRKCCVGSAGGQKNPATGQASNQQLPAQPRVHRPSSPQVYSRPRAQGRVVYPVNKQRAVMGAVCPARSNLARFRQACAAVCASTSDCTDGTTCCPPPVFCCRVLGASPACPLTVIADRCCRRCVSDNGCRVNEGCCPQPGHQGCCIVGTCTSGNCNRVNPNNIGNPNPVQPNRPRPATPDGGTIQETIAGPSTTKLQTSTDKVNVPIVGSTKPLSNGGGGVTNIVNVAVRDRDGNNVQVTQTIFANEHGVTQTVYEDPDGMTVTQFINEVGITETVYVDGNGIAETVYVDEYGVTVTVYINEAGETVTESAPQYTQEIITTEVNGEIVEMVRTVHVEVVVMELEGGGYRTITRTLGIIPPKTETQVTVIEGIEYTYYNTITQVLLTEVFVTLINGQAITLTRPMDVHVIKSEEETVYEDETVTENEYVTEIQPEEIVYETETETETVRQLNEDVVNVDDIGGQRGLVEDERQDGFPGEEPMTLGRLMMDDGDTVVNIDIQTTHLQPSFLGPNTGVVGRKERVKRSSSGSPTEPLNELELTMIPAVRNNL